MFSFAAAENPSVEAVFFARIKFFDYIERALTVVVVEGWPFNLMKGKEGKEKVPPMAQRKVSSTRVPTTKPVPISPRKVDDRLKDEVKNKG